MERYTYNHRGNIHIFPLWYNATLKFHYALDLLLFEISTRTYIVQETPYEHGKYGYKNALKRIFSLKIRNFKISRLQYFFVLEILCH